MNSFSRQSEEDDAKTLFNLPEKVMQFGTGMLLRGLPDYLIDKANKQGLFNGRIVAIKSTAGTVEDFTGQENLYSIRIKGTLDGRRVNDTVISSAISRVLSVHSQWNEILQFAESKDLKVVISNTTELGIAYTEENITGQPPSSYPAKLLSILHHRFKKYANDRNAGLIIIPTELIARNGEVLKSIILRLAAFNGLEEDFITWVQTANRFCNSLVDRIVTKNASPQKLVYGEKTLYDALSITTEPYCLWAIEGNEELKNVLSFYQADEGVLIAPDISKYTELKLRLLNAAHTAACAVALLSGFNTVYEAVHHASFKNFLNKLMFHEIIPSLPASIPSAEARQFAQRTLERFGNKSIGHHWWTISKQSSTKIRNRLLPLLHHSLSKNIETPALAFGFAAFIRFMKVRPAGTGYLGCYEKQEYMVEDQNAGIFYEAWKQPRVEETVNKIFADPSLWDVKIQQNSTFKGQVVAIINAIEKKGVLHFLEIYY